MSKQQHVAQRVSAVMGYALAPWQRRVLCALCAVHSMSETCAWCRDDEPAALASIPKQRTSRESVSEQQGVGR